MGPAANTVDYRTAIQFGRFPDPHMSSTWAIVIFASREAVSVLRQTVRAALLAAQDKAHIDILVNGNPALAHDFAACLSDLPTHAAHATVRVWSIEQGGKANAWNTYLHQIWSDEPIAFFIDGYARLNADAVQLLGDAVLADTTVLGGTGIPSVGRSAPTLRAQMMQHGGFHGNFCCIRADAIRDIRARGISLPFGLYRVDSLMGALLSYGLHPEHADWNHRRILVHPQASWQTDAKHWWRLSDVKAQLKRMLRQSRGVLENEAVKELFVVRKLPAERLPATAAELVLNWVARCPDAVRRMAWRDPFLRRTLAEIRLSLGHTADGHPPTLVATRGPAA